MTPPPVPVGDPRLRGALDGDAPSLRRLDLPTPSLAACGEAPQRTVLAASSDAPGELPLVVVLPGAGGGLGTWCGIEHGPAWIAAEVQRLALPCRLAFVDSGTALGGTQWVDSPAGPWGAALWEVVAGLRSHLATSSLVLAGKSSGGFAALAHAACADSVAALAPDCGLEAAFTPLLRRLAGRWAELGLDPADPASAVDFYARLRSLDALTPGDTLDAVVAMCAVTFSPPSGPLLPVDTEGAWRSAGWESWQGWDPLAWEPPRRPAGELTPVHLAVGDSDEFRLTAGVVELQRRWPHATLEVVHGGHAAVDAHFPAAIAAALAAALAAVPQP